VELKGAWPGAGGAVQRLSPFSPPVSARATVAGSTSTVAGRGCKRRSQLIIVVIVVIILIIIILIVMNVAAPHIVQLDRVSQRPQVSLADEQLCLLAAELCHRIAPLEGPAPGCALI